MKKIFVFFILLLLLVGCDNKNRFAIDTNQDRISVDIKRFDKAIVSIDTANIVSGVEKLIQDFPEYFPLYVSNVTGSYVEDNQVITDSFTSFLKDTTFVLVNNKVLRDFQNIDDIESVISDAYTYIHHYFPEIHLPEVYFFVSGFNLSIMMTNDVIAMGTDMYLGADYPLYQDLTYQYMTLNMNCDNLAPDLVSALLFRHFLMDTNEGRLLDHMLFRGKVMYLLSVFMPDVQPEYLIGYTSEQLSWCSQFEKKIWAGIIDNKHLFSTDNSLIKKYLNDAPFTSSVSPDSPGRVGTWIGWQIVKSYMENNTDLTLRDLMNQSDYQKMLELSGYRP